MTPKFQTPILFIIFNRPETTRRVFETIKAIRPAKLFIAADGPRNSKSGEDRLCQETREIATTINWPCEVKTLFREKNLGCQKGVSSAINWFFDQVEEGIILEDDCLPNSSFFSFCQELLEKYRDNDRIKMISGTSFQSAQGQNNESYYFSQIPTIWGWATWRRAWQEYDIEMKSYPDFKKENRITEIFDNKKTQKYWLNLFDKLYDNKIDTWDGQWIYNIYDNNGLSITPNINLISNIGFGTEATHTKSFDKKITELKTGLMSQIRHPASISPNKKTDQLTFKLFFATNLIKKIKNKLGRFFN